MSIDADIDLSVFITAVEGQNREQQLDLYADHAEMCIFDADTSLAPRLLTGKAAIAGWIDDMCAPAQHHRLTDFAATDNQLSYTDHCRKPQGLNTVYQSTAELHEGRITHQTVTVVWEDCPY